EFPERAERQHELAAEAELQDGPGTSHFSPGLPERTRGREGNRLREEGAELMPRCALVRFSCGDPEHDLARGAHDLEGKRVACRRERKEKGFRRPWGDAHSGRQDDLQFAEGLGVREELRLGLFGGCLFDPGLYRLLPRELRKETSDPG